MPVCFLSTIFRQSCELRSWFPNTMNGFKSLTKNLNRFNLSVCSIVWTWGIVWRTLFWREREASREMLKIKWRCSGEKCLWHTNQFLLISLAAAVWLQRSLAFRCFDSLKSKSMRSVQICGSTSRTFSSRSSPNLGRQMVSFRNGRFSSISDFRFKH